MKVILITLNEKKLNDIDVFIQYDTYIQNIDKNKIFAKAQLKLPDGKLSEKTFKRIIGADGVHSRVRKLVTFQFKGRIYPEKWSVAEIVTNSWKNDIQAKLFLLRWYWLVSFKSISGLKYYKHWS